MKSEVPVPAVAGVVVAVLAIVVGILFWTSSPHPRAPKPGEVIQAPRAPGAGPRSAP